MNVLTAPLVPTLLVLLACGGGARSVAHPGPLPRGPELPALSSRADPTTQEAPAGAGTGSSDTGSAGLAEAQAISEVELAPPARAGAGDASVRLVQIGNPTRRPTPPDLSRAGDNPFPGRLTLEVPAPGLAWGDSWVPPGIYRLSLVSDGLDVTIRAEPLATAEPLRLPIELGTMTTPGSRFLATLARRTVELEHTGVLTIRWGALLVRATLTAPEPVETTEDPWTLARVPSLVDAGNETYLGTLAGGVIGSGTMEARWVREGSDDHRLRLELSRRRRFRAMHRESLARARRLHTIAEARRDAGDEESATRTTHLAKTYEERAARLESQARALEGSSREIVGRARPAVAGRDRDVRLTRSEGKVILVIEGPDGGAEFVLPNE